MVEQLLAKAIANLDGVPRQGQKIMALEVYKTITGGVDLLVQAGTGTGKSLGYLIPAAKFLSENPKSRVIIATATLALQSQLANSDIPRILKLIREDTGKELQWCLLKGRSNYLCLAKMRAEYLAEDQESLVSANVTEFGAELIALREWGELCSENKTVADRDLAPKHSQKAWQQLSTSATECPGIKCPHWNKCFANQAREKAKDSQIIVTNHAILAIDAENPGSILPEAGTIIVDEAHELTARMVGAHTKQLSLASVKRWIVKAKNYLQTSTAVDLEDSLAQAQEEIENLEPQRFIPGHPFLHSLQALQNQLREAISEMTEHTELEVQLIFGEGADYFSILERMTNSNSNEVVWLNHKTMLYVAPISIAHQIQEGLFQEHQMVLTSATLTLNGSFQPIAKTLGLQGPYSDTWKGIDVGSPFDYPSQGRLYIAKQLPANRVSGIPKEVLAEVAELVWASSGGALGLFSSQAAAELAARYCRDHIPEIKILCQGEARLSDLQQEFILEPKSSLFGTLSLWQGIDAPGDTCRLVIIDKIPFPRPDDPLFQARQEEVQKRGGNGFMEVAATHAALLLAQGAGRLIRRNQDQGLVAILDPRLATARYGAFLRRSLPAFTEISDLETAVQYLKELSLKQL